MAKKNNKNNKRLRALIPSPAAAGTANGPTRVPAAPIGSAAIDALRAEAEESLPDELVDAVAVVAEDSPPEHVDLQALWRTGEAAKRAWDDARYKCDAARREIEIERERFSMELTANGDRARELDEQTRRLNDREGKLTEAERELVRRETEWDSEFAQKNRASLATLYTEREKLVTTLAALEDQLRERRLAFDREIGEERHQVGVELAAERDALREQQRQLRRQQADLQADQQDLQQDRSSLDARVRKLAAQKVTDLQAEIDSFEQQLDQARSDRERLRQQLAERDEAMQRFEGRPPEDILREFDEIREELRARKQELAARPSEQHVEDLRTRVAALEAERTEQLEKLREQGLERARLQRQRVEVWELETLRAEKDKLEAYNHSVKKAFDDLRTDIERLSDDRPDRQVFPSLLRIDATPALQARPGPCATGLGDLKRLATDLRHLVARFPTLADPSTSKRLYYEARDIRAFLGGLATSRLHILQGPSGTGKTSLPRAFAWALGASVFVIPVQAGWRERADLLGYYNAFEKRFHETSFLEALYEAGTPHLEHLPCFIVLDEMNLSRPEQYFADFLSLLERSDTPDPLTLVPTSPQPVPRHLVNDGRALALPSNVWFIGTANKDETTLELAPKTYDRAHVMELPRRHIAFEVELKEPILPIPWTILEGAFERAVDRREHDAKVVLAFLTGRVADLLFERFDTQYGNRLELQALHYVPVIVDAGGTAAEAADHLLATRFLRQIIDRPGVHIGDLGDLRAVIDDEAQALGPGIRFDRSLAILDHERRRVESMIG